MGIGRRHRLVHWVLQALALTDLKPGWVVSVTTKHEGANEVAEVVKVVLEK